ncbi:aminoglycoside phosphotransferase family protein [Pseudarthrobacter sp. BIM B-2242]|uniref:aminoglycoside phosphotransferase family protein n=1 Tax=Pseudarthrobacter sp. BIM B-2242 TaxID=2772401 RepID=UPI00168BB380|nr:aminoglycoside phosphotransferase family protein [Pseudarthrobacter sp. BIM B-2242]QOD05860.1 phosphotransferase [Pseudarthrobacter sp. BIM B-2242]
MTTTLLAAPLVIPESLRRNIAYFRGDAADAWLADALDLAQRLADSWHVAPETILEGGAMSLCMLCRLEDGSAAVLKIPESRGAGTAESSALQMWSKSAPDVLATDQRSGAFLMEFITATGTQPNEEDIAGLLDRLHVPTTPRLHPLDDVLQARIGAAAARFTGLAPETGALQDAAAVIAALQRTAQPTTVHGDFQAKNVIHTATGALAIDPLPAAGDPYSDLGLWIGTGSGGPRSAAIWHYSEAAADPRRLLAWAWALTVLEFRHGRGRRDAREFIEGNRHIAADFGARDSPVRALAA